MGISDLLAFTVIAAVALHHGLLGFYGVDYCPPGFRRGSMPCCSSTLVRLLAHLNSLLSGHFGHPITSKLQTSPENTYHLPEPSKCLFLSSL